MLMKHTHQLHACLKVISLFFLFSWTECSFLHFFHLCTCATIPGHVCVPIDSHNFSFPITSRFILKQGVWERNAFFFFLTLPVYWLRCSTLVCYNRCLYVTFTEALFFMTRCSIYLGHYRKMIQSLFLKVMYSVFEERFYLDHKSVFRSSLTASANFIILILTNRCQAWMNINTHLQSDVISKQSVARVIQV